MRYEFNKSYFSQLCAERKLTNVALQKALNMTNTTPMNRWRVGEDIRSDHIVRICNAFNVSPSKFYLCDGQILSVPILNPITEVDNINSLQEKIAFLQERLEFEKEKLMFEKEKHELLQKQIQRERNEIRKEIKQEYEDEIIALRKQLSANIKHLE